MSSRVLVIDDSGLARRNARQILASSGFDVIEAHDGISGLERYFVDKPDVVLLDLVMNGMYGLEVLGKLLEMDPGARVIVVSADIQKPSRDLAASAGALAFVNKPLDERQLLDAVAEALGETR
jgi:two-component system, chemotaxis family, chemotaxis protein CheY